MLRCPPQGKGYGVTLKQKYKNEKGKTDLSRRDFKAALCKVPEEFTRAMLDAVQLLRPLLPRSCL